MCDINEMLNNFMHEQELNDDALRYRYTVKAGGTRLICSDEGEITYHEWQQDRERYQEDVLININETYRYWHDQLRQNPRAVVTEILNWGFGENNNRQAIVTTHTKSVGHLLEHQQDNIDQIDDDLFQRANNHFSDSWNKIASWSKVLAAYDQTNFFIYDSRVAMALNIIDNNSWYLPEGKGHNVVSAIIKQNQTRGQVRTLKESYQCYCNSLRGNGGGAALERKLFMLGKMLDFQCNAWRNCIFVNPALVNQ